MSTAKELVREVLETQPDDSTYDEIMRELLIEWWPEGWRMFVPVRRSATRRCKGGSCNGQLHSGWRGRGDLRETRKSQYEPVTFSP